MILADLSGRKRREVISYTLAPILKRLKAPVETRVIVQQLADVLETTEYRSLTETVIKLAPEIGPKLVRQAGAEFVRFGRVMRRWEWGPPAPDYDPGRSSEGLEDLL